MVMNITDVKKAWQKRQTAVNIKIVNGVWRGKRFSANWMSELTNNADVQSSGISCLICSRSEGKLYYSREKKQHI